MELVGAVADGAAGSVSPAGSAGRIRRRAMPREGEREAKRQSEHARISRGRGVAAVRRARVTHCGETRVSSPVSDLNHQLPNRDTWFPSGGTRRLLLDFNTSSSLRSPSSASCSLRLELAARGVPARARWAGPWACRRPASCGGSALCAPRSALRAPRAPRSALRAETAGAAAEAAAAATAPSSAARATGLGDWRARALVLAFASLALARLVAVPAFASRRCVSRIFSRFVSLHRLPSTSCIIRNRRRR